SEASIPPYDAIKEVYNRDAEFVKAIEASVPPHAMIFQLPYQPFPEGPRVGDMLAYEPLRAYLHSKTLRWSHGGMKGRHGDSWYIATSTKPPSELIKTLASAGFSGIYIDRFGFVDRGAQLEAELSRLLNTRPLVSADARYSFLNMVAFR